MYLLFVVESGHLRSVQYDIVLLMIVKNSTILFMFRILTVRTGALVSGKTAALVTMSIIKLRFLRYALLDSTA